MLDFLGLILFCSTPIAISYVIAQRMLKKEKRVPAIIENNLEKSKDLKVFEA